MSSYTTPARVTWEFLLGTEEIHVYRNQEGTIHTLKKGPLEAFRFEVFKVL